MEEKVGKGLKQRLLLEDYLSRLKKNRYLREYWANIFLIVIVAIPFSIFFIQGLYFGFFELEHSTVSGMSISAIFYNLFIISVIILISFNIKIRLSPSLLYLGFFFVIFFVIIYLPGMFSGDVTQVVFNGARLLWEGKNPYDPVAKYIMHGSPTGASDLHAGTYPYLPVDLLSYGLILGLFNFISSLVITGNVPIWLPGFNNLGVALANLILIAGSCTFLYLLFPEDRFQGPLLGFLLIFPFIWSNAPLMMFFAIAGLFFFKSTYKYKDYLTMILLSLSALSKYYAGIFLVAFWITYLYEKDWKKVIAAPGIPFLGFIITALPFNMMWVFQETVIFYNSARRYIEDGSLGGTLVAEFAKFFNLIDLIGVLTFIGLILVFIVGLYIKENVDLRLVEMSLLSLLAINSIAMHFLIMAALILILFDYCLITSSQRRKYASVSEESVDSDLKPSLT
ncbi:MAG: hypothetical protein ACXAC8_14140 [Candidatus Hodarchaeales archaeon]|jgi:hypothetical protein